MPFYFILLVISKKEKKRKKKRKEKPKRTQESRRQGIIVGQGLALWKKDIPLIGISESRKEWGWRKEKEGEWTCSLPFFFFLFRLEIKNNLPLFSIVTYDNLPKISSLPSLGNFFFHLGVIRWGPEIDIQDISSSRALPPGAFFINPPKTELELWKGDVSWIFLDHLKNQELWGLVRGFLSQDSISRRNWGSTPPSLPGTILPLLSFPFFPIFSLSFLLTLISKKGKKGMKGWRRVDDVFC